MGFAVTVALHYAIMVVEQLVRTDVQANARGDAMGLAPDIA